MNMKDMKTGLVLLVVAIVLYDLSRQDSILRAGAGQLASSGLNDILAGLLG